MQLGHAVHRPSIWPRRSLLAGSLAFCVPAAAAAEPVRIRIGLVQFGTVKWIADTIRRHGLDAAHGFTLEPVVLASPDAGRIAIMGGQADIVVLDWPFVAAQRGAGTGLCFAPLSSATGAMMGRPQASTGIGGLAGLKGRRLGVAGGPLDKSWLIVQAAARKQAGIDLATAARIAYASPPLLNAKLVQGELDAVLTFWNFAAGLEAAGYAEIASVAQCAARLGLRPPLDLIGFVFHQNWAEMRRPAVDGFLSAARQAAAMLAQSDDDWRAIRPLLGPVDDRTAALLRKRFAAGVASPLDSTSEAQDAARLLAVLRETGGARATGGMESIPAGTFWRSSPGPG